MPDIKEILDRYGEEILLNTLTGKIISGDIKWANKPIVVSLEKIESNRKSLESSQTNSSDDF